MDTNSIIYINFPTLFDITFTYHDVQTQTLTLLNMGTSK